MIYLPFLVVFLPLSSHHHPGWMEDLALTVSLHGAKVTLVKAMKITSENQHLLRLQESPSTVAILS